MQLNCTCPQQLHTINDLCTTCVEDYQQWRLWFDVFRNAETLASHMTPAEQEEAA